MMSSKSGVRSHISRFSSRLSGRTAFSLRHAEAAGTGVLCFGGAGSAAMVCTGDRVSQSHMSTLIKFIPLLHRVHLGHSGS